MTFKGITVSVEAYEKLKALKGPGDSFSKVLLRELPGTAQIGIDDTEILRLCRQLNLAVRERNRPKLAKGKPGAKA